MFSWSLFNLQSALVCAVIVRRFWPALSSAWLEYHSHPRLSTLFFKNFRYFWIYPFCIRFVWNMPSHGVHLILFVYMQNLLPKKTGANRPRHKFYFAVSSIFSRKMPWPRVGSFTKTWVTAPMSFPSWMMGLPDTVDVNMGQQIFSNFLVYRQKSLNHV